MLTSEQIEAVLKVKGAYITGNGWYGDPVDGLDMENTVPELCRMALDYLAALKPGPVSQGGNSPEIPDSSQGAAKAAAVCPHAYALCPHCRHTYPEKNGPHYNGHGAADEGE